MSVGNFKLEGAETVYVDYDEVYGTDEDSSDDENRYFRYQDFICALQEHLPKTFEPCPDGAKTYQDNCRVIAESKLFVITVREWEGYIAVNLDLRDDILDTPSENMAKRHQASNAKKFFDALLDRYTLRVRCCAWTSGSYMK